MTGVQTCALPISAGVASDIAGIASAGTQLVAKRTEGGVTVQINYSNKPIAPEGSDIAPEPYGAVFTAMSTYAQINRALKLRFFGFRGAKVKTGVEGVDDQAMLKRLRFLVGRNFDLRIDANEAWTCDNLEAKLAPLLPFRITSVEQPVPHEEVDGLARLRGRIGVPLMLDESLCSLVDARRAIERGTCDLFNIRLSKCGGFLNSLRIAALAHQAGLGYQLGCQVGETGILSAAGRHFATSVADIRYLEGSYDRFLVKERLTVEDITFEIGRAHV